MNCITKFFGALAMADLAAPNPQDPTKRDRVWSDSTFAQLLGIAGSPAGAVGSDRIGLCADHLRQMQRCRLTVRPLPSGTVTRRTAAETAAVVEFVNSKLLSK